MRSTAGYVAGNIDSEPIVHQRHGCLRRMCRPRTLTWYRDADVDGLGDPSVTISACSEPAGYVSNPEDAEPSATTTPMFVRVCRQRSKHLVRG